MTGRFGSIPPADALPIPPGPTISPTSGARHYLTWHGRRLLEDFAPRHALRVFDKARSSRDSKGLQDAVEEARKLTATRLTVELTPRELTIDEEPEPTLTMTVGRRGDLPEGDAVAFVSAVDSSALSIKEKASRDSRSKGPSSRSIAATPRRAWNTRWSGKKPPRRP